MINLDRLLEYSEPGDPFLDFCLWEYQEASSPEDKFRSINLLLHSFSYAGVDSVIVELCNAIRQGVGDWRTVWGVKQVDGKLSWEFYFYDYNRAARTVSISRLIKILQGYTRCDLDFDENCLYFMFSIDIDNDLLKRDRDLDEINVYIGNIGNFGNMISSGISYEYTQSGLTLDNLYYFFDASRGLPDIADKIVSSVHVQPEQLDMDLILMPELRTCKTIVVANKKKNDGIYFSGITIDQLLYFLEEMAYPEQLVSFIRDNRDRLDHLQYDVGMDYRMENGALEILKSSYYGVF